VTAAREHVHPAVTLALNQAVAVVLYVRRSGPDSQSEQLTSGLGERLLSGVQRTTFAHFEDFGFCEGFRPPGMRASPSVVAAGGRKAQCTKSRDGNDGRTARYGDFAAGSGTHLTRIEGSTINSAGITARDPGRGRAGGRFARGK
jgi:hypothetical protein